MFADCFLAFLEEAKSDISAGFSFVRTNGLDLYDRAGHGIDCAYRKSFREIVSCPAHPDQPAANTISSSGLVIPGENKLALRPEILNSEFDYIPSFEEYGIRFVAKSNTRRRAGSDHFARFQLKEPGHIGDDRRDAENKILRSPILITMPIDLQPKSKISRKGNLVPSHKPWPHRGKTRKTLSFRPLAATFHLILTFGKVVKGAIARDIRQGVFLRNVEASLSNNDGKFHFPISFL